MKRFVEGHGRRWLGVIESPLKGREGNIEFLAYIGT
jgi:predicted rRNA methylase YqxC with S4 and FtsJ domains